MAKALRFKLGETELSVELGTKIDKRALYGYARRIAQKDGKELERGLLLPDGALLPRSALSSIRTDPDGTPVETPQVLIDGQPAELQPSSFDQIQALEPATWLALAEFSVRDVYPLGPVELAPGIFRTQFAYRASVQPNEALLLVRADAAFLLVGVQKRGTALGLVAAYDFFDADDSSVDADELDFSMI